MPTASVTAKPGSSRPALHANRYAKPDGAARSAAMMAKCADVCVHGCRSPRPGRDASGRRVRLTAKALCEADEAAFKAQGRLSWGIQAGPRMGVLPTTDPGVLAVTAKKQFRKSRENRLNLAL